jgi:hypothetical protein
MPKVSNLLSFEDLNFILRRIFATNTGALYSACFTLGEALAVEFETVYFCTLTATVLSWRKVKLFDYFRRLGGYRFKLKVG